MTTKSLQELSELCRSERLAYKKGCNDVAGTDNESVRVALGKLANGHKQRYETLCCYLEKN